MRVSAKSRECGATFKEIQAGRFFNITVDFPAGFEIGPGMRPELTVKTSDPRHPVLRAPIFQGARIYRPQPVVTPPRSVVTDAVAIPVLPAPPKVGSAEK